MSDIQSVLLLIAIIFGALLWRYPDEIRRLITRTKNIEISKKGVKIDFAVQSAIESFEKKGAEVPSETEIEHQLEPLKGFRRVLWVDDNPGNVESEAMTLLGLGWQVDLAYNNDHAVRLANHFPYDLLVSDIGRSPPETTTAGLELPSKLRNAGLEPPPIVYYVGVAEQPTTKDGHPVTDRPDTLFAAIDKALSQ